MVNVLTLVIGAKINMPFIAGAWFTDGALSEMVAVPEKVGYPVDIYIVIPCSVVPLTWTTELPDTLKLPVMQYKPGFMVNVPPVTEIELYLPELRVLDPVDKLTAP